MKAILFMILFLLPLWGDIDAQIEAIQRAPVSERFKLMNDFKKKIIQMREKERMEAVRKLQSITQNKDSKKVFKSLKNKKKKQHINRMNSTNELERDDEIDDLREDHRNEERDDVRDNEKDDL